MRNLIRLFLFTMARLALVLAVVLCGVGQYGVYEVEVFMPWGYAGFTICKPGIITQVTGDSRFPFFSVYLITKEDYANDSVTSLDDYNRLASRTEEMFSESLILTNLSFSDLPSAPFIGLPHWLTITASALFYAFLKYAYRKRPLAALESASPDR